MDEKYDPLESLKAICEGEKLVIGPDSVIESRYSTNFIDYGLLLKQTLSFKRDEPTHKYFKTGYNLSRIVNRLNLKDDDRTVNEINTDLEQVYPNDLEFKRNSESFTKLPKVIEKDLKSALKNSIAGFIHGSNYVYHTVDNKVYIYLYKNINTQQKVALFALESNEIIIGCNIHNLSSPKQSVLL